jgi:DeoR/GlpR family transcriptional regulator of sugar metabolism
VGLAVQFAPEGHVSRQKHEELGFRMLRLAHLLHQGGAVTSIFIRAEFKVSLATAKRDLVLLERALPVRVEWYRPHGAPIFTQAKELRLMPQREASL